MGNILSGVVHAQLVAALIVVVIELAITLLFWVGVELGWQFVLWFTRRTFGEFVPVSAEEGIDVR